MYTYDEIKDLLSPAASKLLNDSDVYSRFCAATESVVLAAIGNNTKTDATLQPFAWIMEYLCGQRMGGASESKLQYDKNNYDSAIMLLKEQNSSRNAGGQTGTMDVPYRNEG
ncbi:MAG TPA: hypothetical protein PKY46_00955 [Ignavibacteriaceae bacterium]|nr:hypothetical protein [Ignavibacteriaceae bacterium]